MNLGFLASRFLTFARRRIIEFMVEKDVKVGGGFDKVDEKSNNSVT